MKVMIIPGNGNTDISENWFLYVKKKLERLGISVIAKNMPDPDLARMKFWLPFIEKNINHNEESILIGHSSGAVASLRYMENHKVMGAVIVGVCHTDLGDNKEKASGYYDKKWDWKSIKNNSRWIIQFASTDDPYIPINEARFIHSQLDTEYYEYTNQGHFGADINKKEFPEIPRLLRNKIYHENSFVGVIIEESLENNSILKKVKIVKTKIEKVTEKHKTPWIKKWTLHTIEIPENQAKIIAKKLSKSLDSKHAWYADFKNDTNHYIIFRNKVFYIDRSSKEQYDKAKEYGISLGIPAYQVDFHPDIVVWKR